MLKAIAKKKGKYVVLLLETSYNGAIWHFVVWGCLHGIYQILGDLCKNVRRKLVDGLQIKTDCFSFSFGRGIITFLMVDFAWLFFRANNMADALLMCRKMIT